MTLEEYRKKYQEVDGIFLGLPTESLQDVQIVTYGKRAPIIEAGQYDDRLILILEGIAEIVEEFPSGLRMIYTKITSGDVIGYYEILINRPKRKASILAVTDVVIAAIPKRTVVEWQDRYPFFTRNVCVNILKRLYQSESLITECNSYDLYRGTIVYLVYAYGIYSRSGHSCAGSIRIRDSRQAMADFLGADVRSVNRAVERLKKEELVTIVRGKVHISANQCARLIAIKNSSMER